MWAGISTRPAARLANGRSLSDRRLCFRTLIPRLRSFRRAHRALVALTREKHRVPLPRELDRAADRGPAVDHDLVVAARRLVRSAGLYVARDLHRILGQRVVRRDY